MHVNFRRDIPLGINMEVLAKTFDRQFLIRK